MIQGTETREDDELPRPSAARRIGFTIAAVAMFIGSLAALYAWLLKMSQGSPSAAVWEFRALEVFWNACRVMPGGQWTALSLVAFSFTALLPATLLSFAKHNRPTHFQNEHWIWSTLLFGGCGAWVFHLVALDRFDAWTWTAPWYVRGSRLPVPGTLPVAAWFSLALPAVGSAVFAAFHARDARPEGAALTIRRARAARLRLTLAVVSTLYWAHSMVYGTAASLARRDSQWFDAVGWTGPNLPRKLGDSAEIDLRGNSQIAETQAEYLSSYVHLLSCARAASLALAVYVLLKIARNRRPLRPRDSSAGAITLLLFLGLAFTYHRGTCDLLDYGNTPQALEPTILSFGLTDPIPIALPPLCAFLAYIAWRDWRSATTLLREHETNTS